MTDLRDWAKLDTEWYEDTDLIAAAEECADAFVMWPVLIAKAKATSHTTRNPDGVILVTPARLAFDVRCAVQAVRQALDALTAHGKIRYAEEGAHKLAITLTGFAKWQKPRGSNADKQQRKNAKKASLIAVSDTTVTPTDTTLTPVRHLDVDLDVDGEEALTSDKKSDQAQIREVFDHWVSVASTGRGRKPLLDKKRTARIRQRLAEDFTVSELCEAITGFTLSSWHNGTDNGKTYLGLETVLRDAAQVEKGIELSVTQTNRAAVDPSGTRPTFTSNDLYRIEAAIGRELSDDEEAGLIAGRSVEAFLAEHGITQAGAA